jgi:hypothetical protein
LHPSSSPPRFSPVAAVRTFAQHSTRRTAAQLRTHEHVVALFRGTVFQASEDAHRVINDILRRIHPDRSPNSSTVLVDFVRAVRALLAALPPQ